MIYSFNYSIIQIIFFICAFFNSYFDNIKLVIQIPILFLNYLSLLLPQYPNVSSLLLFKQIFKEMQQQLNLLPKLMNRHFCNLLSYTIKFICNHHQLASTKHIRELYQPLKSIVISNFCNFHTFLHIYALNLSYLNK